MSNEYTVYKDSAPIYVTDSEDDAVEVLLAAHADHIIIKDQSTGD